MPLPVLLLIAAAVSGQTFAERQRRAPRVREARAHKSAGVQQLFARAGIAYPPAEILMRVYKDEDLLELWAGDRGEPLVRVETYAICDRSGELGPKRRRGDLQVPEGFYRVVRFNAWSAFHLSLGINYPNESDRILGSRKDPGGDIFIHGECVTIGCIPIENEPIEELYVIALDARLAGRPVHVHIFPRALDPAGLAALAERAGGDQGLLEFWRGLAPGWRYFEDNKRIPRIRIDKKTGAYRLATP